MDDIEGGRVDYVDDKIIGFLVAKSNQTGIVFIWDLQESKLLHVSDGAYAIAVTEFGGYIYVNAEI